MVAGETRFRTKRVDELEPGDSTPWYTVSAEPELNEFAQDWYAVRVFFIGSEHAGWIHQRGSDVVPVETQAPA